MPLILSKGGAWYAKIGTEKSKGTKIFSLVGKINNTGLVEVPMGITLREIIFDIGGGIPGGKKFKAVQTGGPSGGCLPTSKLDLPIDYESLTAAAADHGLGRHDRHGREDLHGRRRQVLPELPARRVLRQVHPLPGGHPAHARDPDPDHGGHRGKTSDIELLEELAMAIKDASMCSLGQTAANPVLTTLRYFKKEYEAHIKEKRCPAGVCKSLIRFTVLPDKCTGCLACKRACPNDCIHGTLREVHTIDQEKCIKCGACYEACKFEAVETQRDEAIAILEGGR